MEIRCASPSRLHLRMGRDVYGGSVWCMRNACTRHARLKNKHCGMPSHHVEDQTHGLSCYKIKRNQVLWLRYYYHDCYYQYSHSHLSQRIRYMTFCATTATATTSPPTVQCARNIRCPPSNGAPCMCNLSQFWCTRASSASSTWHAREMAESLHRCKCDSPESIGANFHWLSPWRWRLPFTHRLTWSPAKRMLGGYLVPNSNFTVP